MGYENLNTEIDEDFLIDNLLNNISYDPKHDKEYVPSDFALEFVNFIKLVNGVEGEENLTPVLHYKMLDQYAGKTANICNMLFRGSAKTTLLEYLNLYLGVYGSLPGFGKVPLALYVSDSIDNGVKNMRKNLEHRWHNSEFLQTYIPKITFTDIRWEFTNRDGNTYICKAYGAKTGVRGTKELGTRPVLAMLDDLISDQDAKSDTIIASVEDTVYGALEYALHPTRFKVIWNGTPFNARDPLYKAIESGAWTVNVFPVCEKFPCTKEEFKGAWPDRFTYEYVLGKYEKALKGGKIDKFNQEMMLRIMSEEERLVPDSNIIWYKRETVLQNKQNFNFYITTDFATSEKKANDYSVVSVWAYSANGDWLWVDGIVKKQLMDKTMNDLFRLVQIYKPKSVGIEVSGQQEAFISWIRNYMVDKNTFFNLASENNGKKPGIRPITDKIQRFHLVVPLFNLHKIWLPSELRDSQPMLQAIDELTKVSIKGFKSKNDDFSDTVSMLASLDAWKPSDMSENFVHNKETDIWELDTPNNPNHSIDSYLV